MIIISASKIKAHINISTVKSLITFRINFDNSNIKRMRIKMKNLILYSVTLLLIFFFCNCNKENSNPTKSDIASPSQISWIRTNGPYGGGWVHTFALRRGESGGWDIFAGTDENGILLSTDNAATWTAINNGLPNTHIYAIETIGKNLFAGTFNGPFYRRIMGQIGRP